MRLYVELILYESFLKCYSSSFRLTKSKSVNNKSQKSYLRRYAFVTVTIGVCLGEKDNFDEQNLTPKQVIKTLGEYDVVNLGEAVIFGAREEDVQMESS